MARLRQRVDWAGEAAAVCVLCAQVVDAQTQEAEAAKAVVQGEEAVANEKAAAAKAIKDECEADLAVAMPLLEAAERALNTLTKNDITEVKAMKNPPKPVKTTMEAVCQMLQIKPNKVRRRRRPRSPAARGGAGRAASRCGAAPLAAGPRSPRHVTAVPPHLIGTFARLPPRHQVNDPANPSRKINDYWGPSQVGLGLAGGERRTRTRERALARLAGLPCMHSGGPGALACTRWHGPRTC
jgi:hypothetical protein